MAGCATTYEKADALYQKGSHAKAEKQWSKLAEAGDTNSMYRLYSNKEYPNKTEIAWLKKAADLNHVEAQHDYGMWLYQQERYEEAGKYLKLAADSNHVQAQHNYGMWLYQQERYGEAEKYLVLAADNAYQSSQTFLSKNQDVFPYLIAIEQGDSSKIEELADFYRDKKDYEEANYWYERCVETSSRCSFRLAYAYYYGEGVAVDYKKSFEWYLTSAQQGNTDAARNLAWRYENGEGVEANYTQAFKWMKYSVDNHKEENAEVDLGRYYINGTGTQKDYAKALQIFKQYYTSNAEAAYQLARMYYYGWGVEQDYQKSYQLSSSQPLEKSGAAMNLLANHHYYGEGRDKNLSKALELYTQAAELGNKYAQYALGLMYENGEGVQKDIRKAFYWYSQAAENGHAKAQNNLGVMYARGEAVSQNYYTAFDWYKKAAINGNRVAQSNLASNYKTGTGTGGYKNLPQAVYWYAKAAQQGHEDSKKEIPPLLSNLTTYYVNGSNVALHTSNTRASRVVKRLPQGSTVYMISKESGWTEVYYPEGYSLGFIENNDLRN